MSTDLTTEDLAHLANALRARLEDEEDEGGPEPVMTSLGYVDLWRDGEIMSFGRVIATIEGGE